jgi:hypothetical protein
MDAAAQVPVLQDFYSPKIQPGSIHAGTTIYDINGHVMIVYDVTPDGSILYMDAHPDESVTRGAYGPQVPKAQSLGGGFKNFRPLKLVGAELRPDGSYIGGHDGVGGKRGDCGFLARTISRQCAGRQKRRSRHAVPLQQRAARLVRIRARLDVEWRLRVQSRLRA